MAVTLSDIAREAGVNVSTVSRALNSGYGVRREVREKILAIAKRLRYRPNAMARALVTGRSQSLGLVVSDIRNPFFAELARGAEDAARAAGYDLVLCNIDLDPAKQMECFRSLVNKHIDGIVMNSVAFLAGEQVQELESSRVPIVLLNGGKVGRHFSTVRGDNVRGGCLVGSYLAGLGHRKTAVLSGPRRNVNLAERVNGFLRAVRAAGEAEEPVVVRGPYNSRGGYEMTRKLLAAEPGVTAIFAASDAIAFGAMKALIEAGRSIPRDISLVGFDDVELCAILHPPLTTVWQPKYELGEAAVEILIRMATNGNKQPEHRIFDVRLIERQSCRPLA